MYNDEDLYYSSDPDFYTYDPDELPNWRNSFEVSNFDPEFGIPGSLVRGES